MRSIRRKQLLKARREQARKLLPPRFGWPVVLLLLTLSAPVIIRIGSHELIHKKKYPLGTAEWKIYSPGQSRLSLMLPGAPQPASGKASASDPAIERVDCYQLSIREFRVAMQSVSFHEGTAVELRQAAGAVAATLKESGEMAEYHETVRPIQRAGRSGMLVTGEFMRDGRQQQFRALLLSEGPKLWQVMVTYPASDREALTASRKVIDSIRIV